MCVCNLLKVESFFHELKANAELGVLLIWTLDMISYNNGVVLMLLSTTSMTYVFIILEIHVGNRSANGKQEVAASRLVGSAHVMSAGKAEKPPGKYDSEGANARRRGDERNKIKY